MKAIVLIFLVLPMLVAAVHDFQAKYPFRATLLDDQGQYYALYWNFSIPEATIQFAVNVSTTGWVGFGVSPTGQMPGSDVIMGWVRDNDGTVYLHDRFADERALPPIDESQDWFLISGEEENGFTILEFSRNLTTCDPRDLEIRAETARVVWSFQANDPTDPLGNTATFHDRMGVSSLNLLGGLTNAPADPDDVQSFVIGVTNVTIPSDVDTTYWCASAQLPPEIISQEAYITRISPSITPNVHAYVHHMLVYLCTTPLNASVVGESGSCFDISPEVYECTHGLLISGWAVGGEDFIYPENVAYPVGGPGAEIFTVIQIHYDNPKLDTDVIDSSGFRFYYTSIPREHRAGILYLGHHVTRKMIIPPNAPNYTITGFCPSNCTDTFLPEGGIRIIGNALHSHLAGAGMIFRHLRWNPECQGMEELEPIDQNLRYDFNYQQFIHFPKEIVVLPNDTLVLECIYNTSTRNSVTLGGETTRQEMCLTFPIYYPRIEGRALDLCVSLPSGSGEDSIRPFVQKYGPSNTRAVQLLDDGDIIGALNAFNWTQSGIIQGLEDSVLHNGARAFCRDERRSGVNLPFPNGVPEVKCPYQPPDTCPSGGGVTSAVSNVMCIMSMLWLFFTLL